MDSKAEEILRSAAFNRYGMSELLALLLSDGKSDKFTYEQLVHLIVQLVTDVHELQERMRFLERRPSDAWMTVRQAMKATGRSKSTIHRAIRTGEIRSKKVGSRRILERESVENFSTFRSYYTYPQDYEKALN